MTMAEQGGNVGKIAFVSWVLDRLIVDRGVEVHKSPQGAANEIRRRLASLGGERPSTIGGWVEEVKPDGSNVSAVRPGVEEL